MALLLQRLGDLQLHGGELALGLADLVHAAVRLDLRHRMRGVRAEGDHPLGEAAHRPHEHPGEAEIDQRAGQRGDHQRDQQQVAGEAQHRLAQRRLVDDDLDEAVAARRRADGADHPPVAGDQRLEGLRHRLPGADVAHVGMVVDLRRHVGRGEQAARIVALQGDGDGADAAQQFLGQLRRDHAVRCRIEHEGRGTGAGEPVGQPVEAEGGDRRYENQHLGEQHEGKGEGEQLAGQAEMARRLRRRGGGGLGRHLRSTGMQAQFADARRGGGQGDGLTSGSRTLLHRTPSTPGSVLARMGPEADSLSEPTNTAWKRRCVSNMRALSARVVPACPSFHVCRSAASARGARTIQRSALHPPLPDHAPCADAESPRQPAPPKLTCGARPPISRLQPRLPFAVGLPPACPLVAATGFVAFRRSGSIRSGQR